MLMALFDRLYLNGNKLTSVPDCIGQLTNLTRFGVNLLLDLVSHCSSCDRLSLPRNHLESLLHSMGNLKKLNW